ncbi:LAGLIDADG family homing endonuclease [Patescibacteria group bacterium]|nr:LAGLIDADG family homing endonuclease [Patescibacteria group bacterium]
MAKTPDITNAKKLSLDFIAGLIAGEGYFGWVSHNKGKQKIAVFQLQMHSNDINLVFAVKNTLGLKEPVYEYNHQDKKNKSLWRHYVKLIVRRREVIKKIIIPAFDNRLYGLKEKQFNQWKKEFSEQEKKWRYHYVERLPKLIRAIPESLDEDFKPKMIGTDKL